MATHSQSKPDLDKSTFIFLLLSGYIREIGVKQLYPDDIIRVCKRFSCDGWDQDLCNSGIKVCNYEVVTRMDGYNGFYKNSFGSLIAKSPGKYIWKVRVNKMNEQLSMFTGIVGVKVADKTKERDFEMSFFNTKTGYGYKCAYEWNYWWKDTKTLDSTTVLADVLVVKLDFNASNASNTSQATLTISNGTKQLSKEDVPSHLKYRLAFSIYYKDDTVEIVDFMYYDDK